MVGCMHKLSFTREGPGRRISDIGIYAMDLAAKLIYNALGYAFCSKRM